MLLGQASPNRLHRHRARHTMPPGSHHSARIPLWRLLSLPVFRASSRRCRSSEALSPNVHGPVDNTAVVESAKPSILHTLPSPVFALVGSARCLGRRGRQRPPVRRIPAFDRHDRILGVVWVSGCARVVGTPPGMAAALAVCLRKMVVGLEPGRFRGMQVRLATPGGPRALPAVVDMAAGQLANRRPPRHPADAVYRRAAGRGVTEGDADFAPALPSSQRLLCTAQLLQRLTQGPLHDLLGGTTRKRGPDAVDEHERRWTDLGSPVWTSLLR